MVFLISTAENSLNGILKSDYRKHLIWYFKNFTAENHLLITVYKGAFTPKK